MSEAQKIEIEENPRLYLGLLCRKKHNWQNTGQSLRYRSKGDKAGGCVECARAKARAAERQKQATRLASAELQRTALLSAGLDPQAYRLGSLCKGRHDWNGFGLTLYRGYKCRECYRAYRAAHRDELNRRRRESRDPELEKIRLKAWKQKPESTAKIMLARHLRTAVKLECLHEKITFEQWNDRLNQFNNCCAYCGQGADITLDHFVTLKKGGSHTLNNVLPACRSCNSSKGDNEVFTWYSKEDCWLLERWQKILSILNRRPYS